MIACVRDLPWARPGDARWYGGSFGSCAQGQAAGAGNRQQAAAEGAESRAEAYAERLAGWRG
jgi:hypothetical protein